MDQKLQLQTTQDPAENGFKLTKKFKSVLFALDVVGFLFWTYAIVHVFVFDVDMMFSSSGIPVLSQLAFYKFILFAGLIGILWFLVEAKWLIPSLLYVLLYPAVMVGWKIPRFLWKAKSPLITLAFLNVVLSFFKSVRYIAIVTSALIVLSGIVFIFSNQLVLYAAVFLMLVTLVTVYFNRFRMILRPSTLYQIHGKITRFLVQHSTKTAKPEKRARSLDISKLPTQQREKVIQDLQFLVIVNRSAYYLSAKLKEYQASNISAVFYLANLFVLILLTTYVFAVMYFGMWKIDSNYFQVTSSDFFIFVYYSFSNVFGRGINEVIPSVNITRLMSIIQTGFSFLLAGIIVTLVFSWQSKRDSKGIDDAVSEIRSQGEEVERFIKSEFSMNSDQAIAELEKGKAAFIKLIYYFTSK